MHCGLHFGSLTPIRLIAGGLPKRRVPLNKESHFIYFYFFLWSNVVYSVNCMDVGSLVLAPGIDPVEVVLEACSDSG
jgi:hypothetical protein